MQAHGKTPSVSKETVACELTQSSVCLLGVHLQTLIQDQVLPTFWFMSFQTALVCIHELKTKQTKNHNLRMYLIHLRP